jgi:hypothetical protein
VLTRVELKTIKWWFEVSWLDDHNPYGLAERGQRTIIAPAR